MGATMGKNGGNLLDSLPSTQGTMHIVMLGLDSAGKTTALYRLKFDQYLNTVPTIGFNCEKVRGTIGRAKGVQFLVWDVGGQEKLRPLWRSYTRCTDGIVFVVDSVDVERMEEAKMELMRTAKCPDNQGVPVLILANKQDLPGAREPKDLEKLLGLHEISPIFAHQQQSLTLSSSKSLTEQHHQRHAQQNLCCNTGENSQTSLTMASTTLRSSSDLRKSPPTPPTTIIQNTIDLTQTKIEHNFNSSTSNSIEQLQQYHQQNFKGWFIQPACAITGEGLQEGLDALHEMIIKKRKINKTNKKKR